MGRQTAWGQDRTGHRGPLRKERELKGEREERSGAERREGGARQASEERETGQDRTGQDSEMLDRTAAHG